jgi:hypothetical protein
MAPGCVFGDMTRFLMAAVIALGLSSVPLVSVMACSCAMPGTTEEIAAAADLAFVGTVIDAAPAPAAPDDFGSMVRYAFQVERASAPTEGVVEVRAVGGDGGASCGIEFGIGQRWFIAAYRDGATLQTDLCSGNLVVEGMAPAERELLAEVLAVEPATTSAPTPVDGPEASLPPLLPAALGGVAAIAIIGVLVVAFGGSGPLRPR